MTPRSVDDRGAVQRQFGSACRDENGRHRGVGDFRPVEQRAEGIRGCGLALFVRLGRRSFRHHQRCGIQGDLESSAGGIHPRVIDGHANSAHDGHSDNRHQRGYTAPGVFEERVNMRLTQSLLKRPTCKVPPYGGTPLEKA